MSSRDPLSQPSIAVGVERMEVAVARRKPQRPPRALVAAAVMAIALLMPGLTSPLAIRAVTCDPFFLDHCHGVADWVYAPSNSGASVILRTDCLYGPNDNQNFLSEELWVGTNNDPDSYSWVETGIAYGELNGQAKGGPYWFWADDTPGAGYGEHWVDVVAYSQTYVAKIRYFGNNIWDVYQDTTIVGRSVGNPPWSKYLSTGMESTSNSYNASGRSSSLKYWDVAGSVYTSWQSGNNHAVISEDHPPIDAYWLTQYVKVAYDEGTCGGMLSPTGSAATTSHASFSSIALASAEGFGDAHADLVGTVLTSRQTAVSAISGSSVDSDESVYVVQLRGSFTGRHAPAGHELPTGTFLTLTIGVTTGEVLDASLTNVPAHLEAVGPVVDLPN